MDLVILKCGPITRTTPELASSLQASAHTSWRVFDLDRFSVHQAYIRGGSSMEPAALHPRSRDLTTRPYRPADCFMDALRKRVELFNKEQLFCVWILYEPTIVLIKADAVQEMLMGVKMNGKSWLYNRLNHLFGSGLIASSFAIWAGTYTVDLQCIRFLKLEPSGQEAETSPLDHRLLGSFEGRGKPVAVYFDAYFPSLWANNVWQLKIGVRMHLDSVLDVRIQLLDVIFINLDMK
ncbi:hypothetical protein AVEN_39753-1 [Araneus ventricosus]|uniref:Uncharacterized protein n=1 Tax=Araneus ventricosus TaxID=182803 RepID=A0A4Y2LNF2_ARAVE|nr:hypothetical protein AVEN_39753-1 [Araneus ventricosus]